jgi:hypothetical protein
MISQETKAKIFALYLNQDVLVTAFGRVIKLTIPELNAVLKYDTENWSFLQVRPISALTDEELKMMCNAIGLARITIHRHENRITIRDDSYTVYFFYDSIIQTLKNNMPYIDQDIFRLYDCLRQLSIALPVTVLENNTPRTYSVQELIDNGVFKVEGI